MRKRNKFVKVIELRHTKSKADRVLKLQPRYENGAVYHKAWMKDGELEEELVRFPKGRRDDVCDAASMLLEIIPARTQKQKVMREQAPKTYLEKLVWMNRRVDRIKKKERGGVRYQHDTLGGPF